MEVVRYFAFNIDPNNYGLTIAIDQDSLKRWIRSILITSIIQCISIRYNTTNKAEFTGQH